MSMDWGRNQSELRKNWVWPAKARWQYIQWAHPRQYNEIGQQDISALVHTLTDFLDVNDGKQCRSHKSKPGLKMAHLGSDDDKKEQN
jgi:hypothetical protein